MVKPASLIEQTLWGVLWSAIGRWGQSLVAFATLAVMARFLGPEIYGLFALAMVMIGLSDAVVNGAFAEALIQRPDLERRHEKAVLTLTLCAAGALSAAVILFAQTLAALLQTPDIASLLPAFVGIIVFGALGSVPNALLQRQMRYRDLVTVDNAAGLLASLIGIVLAVTGCGIWSLIAMETARALVRAVGFAIFARWRPGVTFDTAAYGGIAPFGLRVVGIRLLQYVDRSTPRVALGVALGPVAVGYYMLGWRIYQQIQDVVVAPMSSVAMPAAARSRDDLPMLRAILMGAARVSSLVAYPVFVGVAAIAPVAVPLLFGPQWGPGVATVQVLALIGVRAAISAFNGGVMRGLGRPDLQMRLVLIGSIATLIMVPLVAQYGSVAVGIAVLARSFLTWPIGASYVQRLTGLPAISQAKAGTAPLVAAGLMGICVLSTQWLLIDQSPLWLTATVALAVGIIAYPLFISILAPTLARAMFRALRAASRGDRAGAMAELRAAGLMLTADKASGADGGT